jgi:hypothetical protein
MRDQNRIISVFALSMPFQKQEQKRNQEQLSFSKIERTRNNRDFQQHKTEVKCIQSQPNIVQEKRENQFN